MRDEILALVRLSEIDDSAKDIDQELQALPARIEEMRADVHKLESLLGMEREQLAEAQALRKAQEQQRNESQDGLSRARAKSAKARTAKEADMAEREAEAVRRTLKEREEEAGRLSEAIGKVEGSLSKHEQEFAEFKALFETEEAEANQRIAELNTERDKVVAGRDVLADKISKQILRRYERIRGQRGTGVSEMKDGICTGCSLRVPPQQAILIQRVESWEQCQHCNRILFFKSIVTDAADTADAVSS